MEREWRERESVERECRERERRGGWVGEVKDRWSVREGERMEREGERGRVVERVDGERVERERERERE